MTLRGEGSPSLPWLIPRLGGCGTPPAPALPRRGVRWLPLGKRRANRLGVLLLLLEALSTGPGVVKVRVSAPARPPGCARWEGNAPAPRVSPGAPRSERWAFGKRGGRRVTRGKVREWRGGTMIKCSHEGVLSSGCRPEHLRITGVDPSLRYKGKIFESLGWMASVAGSGLALPPLGFGVAVGSPPCSPHGAFGSRGAAGTPLRASGIGVHLRDLPSEQTSSGGARQRRRGASDPLEKGILLFIHRRGRRWHWSRRLPRRGFGWWGSARRHSAGQRQEKKS